MATATISRNDTVNQKEKFYEKLHSVTVIVKVELVNVLCVTYNMRPEDFSISFEPTEAQSLRICLSKGSSLARSDRGYDEDNNVVLSLRPVSIFYPYKLSGPAHRYLSKERKLAKQALRGFEELYLRHGIAKKIHIDFCRQYGGERGSGWE